MRNSFNPVNYKTIKLIAAAEQRVVRQAFPVTISDLEPDKLGQPFRPAIFEIRDSNRPLSFSISRQSDCSIAKRAARL